MNFYVSVKALNIFSVYLLILVSLASLAYAESDYLVFSFTGEPGAETVNDITVQTRNAFYVLYNPYTSLEFKDFDPDRLVRLTDGSGMVITEKPFSDPFFTAVDSRIKKISLIASDGSTYLEHNLSMCDYDGVCEPCTGSGCNSVESSLTCSDCPSGTFDRFCDLEKDSVCDPDCRDIDGDCKLCNSFCFFKDDEDFSCEGIGGSVCGPKEDCYGGRFIYSEDYPESCCMRGICRDLGEYVETMVELQTMPYLTVTPSGATGADIYSWGGPDGYCVYGLEGTVCPQGQLCDGVVEEHVAGHFCCFGTCKEIKDAGSEVVYDFPVEPLSEEEVEEMMGADIIDDSYLIEDGSDDYFDVVEDDYIDTNEKYQMELEDEIAQELEDIKARDTEEVFLQYLPRAVRGFSMPLVTVGVLIILFLLVVLILVFRRSADKAVASEVPASEQDSQQPHTKAPAVPVQNLQLVITSLLAKGYSYQQISVILIRQGHEQQFVKSEIMRHYRSRRGGW